jgi:hypothetical protein
VLKIFPFWDDYTSMVQLLLQFIKAKWACIWDLHLSSVANMAPEFYAMNRTNYWWLPVYLGDMNQLPNKHPNIHQEFMSGYHGVHRSTKPFARVRTDIALEQSMNLDYKSKGGIIGISQKPAWAWMFLFYKPWKSFYHNSIKIYVWN